MIVVIIIGLIAGMAMPQFHKMIEEAKIREAKSILRAIRGAEKIFKAETTINGTYVGVDIDPSGYPQGNCDGAACVDKRANWALLNIDVSDSADWRYGAAIEPPNGCNAPPGDWGTNNNNLMVVPWAQRQRGVNIGEVLHIQMASGDFIPATGLDTSITVDCTQQR